MKAAGGRRSPPTSRRWKRWCARSNAPASRRAQQVAIALDVAASEFGRGGKYKLALEDKELDSEGMIRLLTGWISRYPIVSIEDPLARGRRCRLRRVHPARSATACRSSATISWCQPGLAGARSGVARRGQRRAAEAQPARHADRDAGCLAGGEGVRLRRHRLGPLRRNRGHHDRASRGRLGRRPAQGRQLRARRADGEMERGAARRGSAGRRARDVCRRRRCWDGRSRCHCG